MKRSLFIIFFLSTFFKISAQAPIEEIASVDGDVNYIGVFQNGLALHSNISGTYFLDLDNYSIEFLQKCESCYSMKPYGDYIYYTVVDSFTGYTKMFMLRYDPVSGNNHIMAYDIGDYSYVSEMEIDYSFIYWDSFGLLSRTSFENPNQPPFYIYGGFQRLGIERVNGHLYYSTLEAGQSDLTGGIYRIDLYDLSADPVIIKDELGFVWSLEIHNNYLYFPKRVTNDPPIFYKICRIDLTDPNFTLEEVSEQFLGSQAIRMEIIGNTLYFTDSKYPSSKIYKLENVLGNPNFSGQVKLALYPNPASANMKIDGINNPTNFQIFSISGVEIMKGVLQPSELLNVEHLVSGVYFLRLEEIGETLRFIKM